MWRGAAPPRRRLSKGCPTRGAAGKLLDEALFRGRYFREAHLDVILSTRLARETIVPVDHIRVEDELVYSLDPPRLRPRRGGP